jgi:membrane protease YdiL (CAAX protease family)
MNAPQGFLVVAPWVLLLTTWVCFRLLRTRMGKKPAYLAGFLFYWLGWCVLVPLWLMGPAQLAGVFRLTADPLGQPAALGFIFLALPPAMSAATIFRANRAQLTTAVLLLSVLLALVNGVCEEIFWRGMYVSFFPDQPFWAWLYPAIGFGLWHLAPQEVLPSTMPGGRLAFALSAIFLGLCFGWVAWQSGSIVLTSVSHILTDFFGLGGLAYLSTQSAPHGV